MSPRSFWGDFWRYERPRRKKPPPERGLAVKKIGATWWGQRWIGALERISLGYSSRLARGRSYARGGRVHDLALERGLVRARVTGTRVYAVEIQIGALGDAAWERAIAAMAAKAAFAAQLLGGAMPQEIDEAFAAAKTSLFPVKAGDLRTSCSCPDWANPCKHVAAVHYVLGEALDRDPFLLFDLRGRGKAEVLAALRGARSAGERSPPAPARRRSRRGPSKAPAAAAPSVAPAIPSVALDPSAAAGYERPRTRLPALHFRLDPPPSPALVLRQLGDPPSWPADEPIVAALAPLCASAAALARSLALGTSGSPSSGAR